MTTDVYVRDETIAHIYISNHLLGGYSCVDSSDSTLVDVKVKFEALAASQYEDDGHWQNARCDHEASNEHYPVRIWFCSTSTLEGVTHGDR
jgi:hypothetical protein